MRRLRPIHCGCLRISAGRSATRAQSIMVSSVRGPYRSLNDLMRPSVRPACTLMKFMGCRPTRLPTAKILKGMLTLRKASRFQTHAVLRPPEESPTSKKAHIGDAALMNQLGRSGEMRRKMK